MIEPCGVSVTETTDTMTATVTVDTGDGPQPSTQELVANCVGHKVVDQRPIPGPALPGRSPGLARMADDIELVMMREVGSRHQTGNDRIVAARLDLDVVRWVGVDRMNGRAIEKPIARSHSRSSKRGRLYSHADSQ